MRKILFLLLASSIAFALVEISAPAPYPLADNGMAASIKIDSTISPDNTESAQYTIVLSNPTNSTIFLTLPISFNYKPESISLKRDGEPVALTVETEQKRGFSRYTDQIGLGPRENVTYTLNYKVLLTPSEYGVWGLRYFYSPPVSFFEARSDSSYVPVRPRYSGKIDFGYAISQVSCNGCSQADDKIEIANLEYFGLNWEKTRTPYRAGLFYLLLLSGMVFFIARARRAIQEKGHKAKKQ